MVAASDVGYVGWVVSSASMLLIVAGWLFLLFFHHFSCAVLIVHFLLCFFPFLFVPFFIVGNIMECWLAYILPSCSSRFALNSRIILLRSMRLQGVPLSCTLRPTGEIARLLLICASAQTLLIYTWYKLIL